MPARVSWYFEKTPAEEDVRKLLGVLLGENRPSAKVAEREELGSNLLRAGRRYG